MATFANIFASFTDDLAYATSVALPTSEGDLGSPVTPPAGYQAILAIVQLAVTGTPASNASYIVMQTDLGDGIWVDCCWCLYTQTSTSQVFTLTCGPGLQGIVGSSAQRAANQSPNQIGSNSMVLGVRIRFVGKATLSGGTNPQVTATVKYKALGLR
jgi:hypothetical protein